MLTINMDTKAAQQTLSEIAQDTKAALAAAVNDAADDTLEKIRSAMDQEINLAPGYIRRHTRVLFRATLRNPTAMLEARSRSSLLYRFATPLFQPAKKRGLKGAAANVQIWRDSPVKHMRGAFFLTLKRGDRYNKGATGLALNVKNPALIGETLTDGDKKRGYKVLHSVSVNAGFERVKHENAPTQAELIDRFMAKLGL